MTAYYTNYNAGCAKMTVGKKTADKMTLCYHIVKHKNLLAFAETNRKVKIQQFSSKTLFHVATQAPTIKLL